MLQHLLSGGPFGGTGIEATLDELSGRTGDVLPTFCRFKFIVTGDDCFRLLGLGSLLEWQGTAEREICDDAHGPYIDGFVVADCMVCYQSTV